MLAQPAWGEDFASDGPVAALTVRDWTQLAPGEAVRFFPALRASTGVVTPQIAERILACAAQLDGGADRARLTPQARENAQWLRSLIASSTARAPAPLSSMARFAFLTGLHPAYVWPEAECLPAWGATAAWLGELSRRRRAILPLEVADYLLDALERREGGVLVKDQSLAGLIADRRLASALYDAALRRQAGQTAPMKMPAEARSFDILTPLRRAVAALRVSGRPLWRRSL